VTSPDDPAGTAPALTQVADAVARVASGAGGPVVVGLSGWCGAGKSTLARAVVGAVPGSVRLRGDDFLDPVRSHRRSSDWDGVERDRLVRTVLDPFRRSAPGTFRRFDWSTRALGPAEPVPRAAVLVVDLIGMFHPDVLPWLDLAVWCDVDQETAARRGMRRDRALGRDHDRLWREVWVPNDRDFARRFAPAAAADQRVAT
jgi:uridine kinase